MINYQPDPQGYYVYAYLRNRDSDTAPAGTPYYIGKGQGTRAWSSGHRVAVPTNTDLIIIIEQNLTNLGALAIERRLIRWYGRKDLGTGILENRTDGGEGVTGRKGIPWTLARHAAQSNRSNKPRKPTKDETKAKISAANKGRKVSYEQRQKHSEFMKGRKNGPCSESTKLKIGNANRGRKLPPRSEEAKIKQSASTKGKPSWTKGLTRSQIKEGKRSLTYQSQGLS